MHTRIQIQPTGQGLLKHTIQVESRHTFVSKSFKNSTLYYSRLPSSLSEEEVINALLERDYSFIANAELNFTIVLVTESDRGPQLTVIRDRFSSQQIYISEKNDEILISTNLKDFKSHANELSVKAITRLLSNRITAHNSIIDSVTALKAQHCIVFDGKLSLLKLPTTLVASPANEPLDDDQAISKIKNSILSTYQQFDENHEVAVLLSGGVDSFILAATAAKYFKVVKLYTPTWEDDDNPELPRATRFAEHLGLPHEVVSISKNDFVDSYNEILVHSPITIRNYSSLILHALFKHIPENYILYGEYADTLFGNNSIKNLLIDSKYAGIIKRLPHFLLTDTLQKFLADIEHSGLENLVNIPQVTPTISESIISSLNVKFCSEALESNDLHRINRYDAVQYTLSSDCAQHMLEIETSALIHDKSVITPFFNQRMIEISNRLNERQIFGKSGLSLLKNFKRDNQREVKPLLKKLACDYIQPEAIYVPKLGFPTPFSIWVKLYIESNLKGEIQNKALTLNTAEAQWSYINTQKIIELVI